MRLKNEQRDLINETTFSDDTVIDELAVTDELDVFEENEEVYKWLSFLLVIIWAATFIFF